MKIYGSPQAAASELRDRKRQYLQNFAQKRALDAGNAGAADALKMQFAQWDQEALEKARSDLARFRGSLVGPVIGAEFR